MKRALCLVPALLLVLSCGLDRDAGRRYRAERDLWKADWEYRTLSIRPQEVGPERWTALAGRYEAIARLYGAGTNTAAASGSSRQQLQGISARALFSAAQVYASLRDSLHMEQIYGKMADEYSRVPEVAAEVALARGRVAESKRDLVQAADFYQQVVDRVEPDPGGTGITSLVLDLPLRIARLRALGDRSADPAGAYEAARGYYERQVRQHKADLIQYDAQSLLAEIDSDLGNGAKAVATLRGLEAQLRGADPKPRDPAEVRLAIAGAQSRAGAPPESIRTTLTSLLKDYPECKFTAQVLFALADNAEKRGQVDEAVGYLDRVAGDSKNQKEEYVAGALLAKAKLLERHDRWQEALPAFRAVIAEHPVSEAALSVPLELAKHYFRIHDDDSAATALEEAVRQCRDFVAKYPPGPLSTVARQHLVQALAMQKNYDSAVTEMVSLGEDLAGTRQGAGLLITAAGMARDALGDTARAAGILDRMGELYAKAEVGNWATREASRLRGMKSQ